MLNPRLGVLSTCGCMLLFGGFTNSICAQTPLTAVPLRVSVEVSGNDDLRELLLSYIGRELRSLPGVTVVDTKAIWEIHVVAVRTENEAGHKTGVAMAIAVEAPFDTTTLRSAFEVSKISISKRALALAQRLNANLMEIRDLRVVVSSDEDLNVACRELVARFDTEQLEPFRRTLDSLDANFTHD